MDIMMPEGYQALHNGAALLELSGRGKIRVTGGDRVRLLHAMVTNHVEQLGPGQGCYAFFLNAQGRILADVNLFRLEEYLLLDTEPETRETIYRHLDHYIIADDVMLADETGETATLGLEGPQAAEVLKKVDAPLPPADFDIREWGDRLVARASTTGMDGYRIFAPAGTKDALVEQLQRAGAVAATPQDIRTVRIENGRPRYGEDLGEDYIPQETQCLHAVHFNKGCYLGQEIVERVRSRGHVNRLLAPLRLAADVAPPPGTLLTADGSEAGKITSAAYSPTLSCVAGLGYVRVQYARPGTKLMAGDAEVTVAGSRPGCA